MANILIVDSDRGLQLLFGKRLEREGHFTLFANDGQEGHDMALQTQPDIIIVDYDLPVLSGHDMLLKLRQTEWGKQVPIIMVATSSSPRHASLEESADLTLYKPVSTLELTTIVKRLLYTTTGETVRL